MQLFSSLPSWLAQEIGQLARHTVEVAQKFAHSLNVATHSRRPVLSSRKEVFYPRSIISS